MIIMAALFMVCIVMLTDVLQSLCLVAMAAIACSACAQLPAVIDHWIHCVLVRLWLPAHNV